MITAVFGKKNSGKSQFAEDLLSGYEGSKYYIATMRVNDENDKLRVEKHRANREGKDFITIEQDVAVVKAIDKIKWMESLIGAKEGKKTALLECIPSLVANEMVLKDGELVPHKDVENTVLFGLAFLKEYFDDIVIVSEEEADISEYIGSETINEETEREYSEAIKELNAAIKVYAEKVYVH